MSGIHSDDENPHPDRTLSQKRKRGPYRLYMDPSQPCTVPRSTVWSWENCKNQGERVTQVGEEQIPNQQLPEPSEEDVDNPPDGLHHISVAANMVDHEHQRIHLVTNDAVCAGVCVCGQCNVDNAAPDIHLEAKEATNPHQGEISYINKYELNEPLLPTISTTKFEVMLMILHLGVRHGMTKQLIEDMLELVNKAIGKSVLKSSYYLFSKVFHPVTQMTFHFYCPLCEVYIGEGSSLNKDVQFVICNNCGENCDVKSLNSGNFFVALSAKHQIELLLNKAGLKIEPHLNRRQDAVKDVMDGDLYKINCLPGKCLANEHAISITFNTDGASVFKSSRGSLWPLQFYINEVSPEERLKSDNVMVAGLWFGKSSPNMALFLTPFVEEFKDLENNGVRHVMADGSVITRPVTALLCSLDSIAKAKVQMVKQHNGKTACSYCLHPNPQVVEDGNRRHYVTSSVYPLRTHERMKQDMFRADKLDRKGELKKSRRRGQERDDSVNGVKGISVLLGLLNFNIVWGFSLDYMHCVLEGVTCAYMNLLLSSESHEKEYYIDPENQKILDLRLTNITPPQAMTRRPRGLLERAKWKAKEWRAFLLWYALPVLSDLLPEKYLNHLKRLVEAFYILLKDSITHVEIQKADDLLQDFVRKYENYFSVHNVTYNVHLLTHLAFSVFQCGPLWASSNFPFEAGNGRLLKLVKGTKGVIHEIGRKYVTAQSVRQYIKDNPVSDEVVNFCSSLFDGYKYVKQVQEFDGVTCLGAAVSSEITQEEMCALSDVNLIENKFVHYYNRVISKKVLYYSKAYTKPKAFDDSVVFLSDNTYAVLHKIFKVPQSEKLLAFIKPVRIAEAQYHLASHIKTCANHAFAPLKVVPFDLVVKKCVYVRVVVKNNRSFICDVPNMYEKD